MGTPVVNAPPEPLAGARSRRERNCIRKAFGLVAAALLLSGLLPPAGAFAVMARPPSGAALASGTPGLRLAPRTALPAFESGTQVAARPARLRRGLVMLLVLLGVLSLQGPAAFAAAEGGKVHLGEKLATFLQEVTHLPNWCILIILSAMPLIELRGGVPVGLWMGKPVPYVMVLCIIGNMLPIPLILLSLRSKKVNDLLEPVLKRARKKTKAIGAHDRWVGIAAFVGVPLPGTGAWTGAMVAHLLGMEFRGAITAVLTGIIVASIIMASLTMAGWYGCAIACCLVAVALGSRYLPRPKRQASVPPDA